MAPEEHARRIADLFKAAIDCAPQDRRAFLDRECCSDSELRAELESLLEHEQHASQFMEEPVLRLAVDAFARESVLGSGQLIDEYEIISLIGKGGMGEVYLAQDRELHRHVALKLVRRGMDNEDIVRRFRHEQRLLAGLNHPHIAQLHGAGVTSDGIAFLVMEHVEGTRIDQYCDDKRLSVQERLQVFRKVCAAVHYAHQHLVVHRDLKPSNILVTAEGEPKLLDFGIAKLLESETEPLEQTITLAGVMTPEYASPEHVRGEPITTTSDVYSLGVLLYELLTEEKPYKIDSRTPIEIARVITEKEPTRPSIAVRKRRVNSKSEIRNSKLLKGDLDNIVLKALRKEPTRRYASVAQFSDDIRGYLDGRPVSARKDTFSYRTAKFIKRNKVAVTAAALVFLSLVGGIVATTLEARRVNRERARAEQRFNDVRRLANSLMFEIHDSVKDLQGATPTRRLIVSRALEYLDSLASEASADAALQRELATAYEKIGDIQGNPYHANLGDIDGALTSYRKALAIRQRLKNVDETNETKMELGRTYRGLGDILEQKADVTGTMENYRLSAAIFEGLAAANPGDPSVKDELARADETLGDGLARSANAASERHKAYQKALSIRRSLLAQDPSNPKLRRSVGLTLLKVGGTADPTKRDSTNSIKEGIVMLEALAAEFPDNEPARREVGYGYYQLGNTLVEGGDYSGALESRRKAFAIRQEIAAKDPKNAQAIFDLAVAHADLSEGLAATGAGTEALDQAQHALSLLQQLSATDPNNAVYRRNIGLCYEKLGVALALLGRDETASAAERITDWTEARSWFEKALRLFSDLRDRGTLMPADTEQAAKFERKIRECDETISRLKK